MAAGGLSPTASNLEARAQMLIASTMGATAFQKGLGAMHSLSHPCSANLDTHHGLTNGVVMPYVLVFNRRAIKDKMKRLASYLGLKRPSFGAVLDWVVELRSTIGIPNTLAELGVTEAHVPAFAKMAMADPSTPIQSRSSSRCANSKSCTATLLQGSSDKSADRRGGVLLRSPARASWRPRLPSGLG